MNKCIQCQEPADMHINWLSRKTETENEPQNAYICSNCMAIIWNTYKNTQFGQTLIISDIK